MIDKIFFWDGRLFSAEALGAPNKQMDAMRYKEAVPTYLAIIDAANGARDCIERLEYAQASETHYYVITNFLQALSANWINTVLFADDPVHRIKEMFYLWGGVSWVPIEKLTDKELRYAHNLAKMYLAGSFNPFQ